MEYLIFLIILTNIILYLPSCYPSDSSLISRKLNSTKYIYTFASSDSFIQLETDELFNIAKPREVNFVFRWVF